MNENETLGEPRWLTVLSWVGGIATMAFTVLMVWPYAPAMFDWTRDDAVLPVVRFLAWLPTALAQLLGWLL
jgi:hypothetical protein